MAIVRLPITTSVDAENAGGGEITNGALAKNALFAKYPSGTVYATQRPALNIREQAADNSLPPKGRGIIYWDRVGAFYIVNDDTVYAGGGSAPLGVNITGGKDPVMMLEMNQYLIILDAQNNEGWYIDSSSPTTLVQITDVDFPGNQAGVHIAGGGAVMDGYLFVMDTTGVIWNSDINDPTTWNAINFITAEREDDAGVYLSKHHGHIVALGTISTEFFFDAGNPVGSPLQRRDDISYLTGAIDRKAVFSTGDNIYFLGTQKTGTGGLYKISQFQLQKVSNDSIDTYVSLTRSRSKFDYLVSGCSVGDHDLIFLTAVSPGTDTWQGEYTLVYDSASQAFTQFETDIADVTAFAVVDVTERSSTDSRESTLLFLSGDLGFFDLTFERLDSAGSGPYMDSDYIVLQDDYVLDIGQDSTSHMEMTLRFGESDFQMLTNKFGYRMTLIGTTTSAASDATPIYISWSDDHYRTFSAERTLDTGLNRSLTRLGKFRRRAHHLRYPGTDLLRIEAIELDVRASQYA